MTIERKTLAASIVIEGLGLHSGMPVRLTAHPSETGIQFQCGKHRVKACPHNVTDTLRSTKLGEIATVEHFMSAMCALGITDIDVDLSFPELPALDGSAIEFYERLHGCGANKLGCIERPDLFRRLYSQEGQASISVSKGTGHWRYLFDGGGRWPGSQCFESSSVLEDYHREIAPARTFAFSEEIEPLQKMGLGQGLSEKSVVVLGQTKYENEVRFADEPARHKLLDLIGDLYLSGVPADALDVVAERSGHRLNVAAAKQLVEKLA